MWWCTPVILGGRRRRMTHEIQASSIYIVRSKPARATYWGLVSKKTTKWNNLIVHHITIFKFKLKALEFIMLQGTRFLGMEEVRKLGYYCLPFQYKQPFKRKGLGEDKRVGFEEFQLVSQKDWTLTSQHFATLNNVIDLRGERQIAGIRALLCLWRGTLRTYIRCPYQKKNQTSIQLGSRPNY